MVLLLGLSASGMGQITIKTYNSFKPSKEKVNAVEQGLADVGSQISSKGSSQQIASDIRLIEKMVADIRKDFKRYKKLEGWDQQLAGFKQENEGLRQAEEQAAAERQAAAAAERQQQEAERKLKRQLEYSRIDSKIAYFGKQPRFKNATTVWDHWKAIDKALGEYLTAYPDDLGNQYVVQSNGIKDQVMGSFKTEVLDFFRPKTTKDQTTVDKVWESKPQNAINILSERIGFEKAFLEVYPGDAYVGDQLAQDEKRYKEIMAYKNDGRWDQWKLDQVTIPAAEGRDSGAESHIRNVMKKEGYEVVVVRMQDANWIISSNEYGIPTHKGKDAVVGVRKDGKCYRIWGEYRKQYAGAGTYNNSGYFRWNDPKEMSCKNLK